MLRTHGPAAHTGELAEGVVVVRHEVHYEAPLVFDFRSVSIECWVTEIRAASFTMAYEIFHTDGADGDDPEADGGRRVYLRATTVLTPYVFATERPRRLSADERETLAVFHEPGEPTRRAAVGPARRDKVGHYPVQVRFSDVDVYGHVNNVRYFEYYMEARILYTARLWRETAEERGRVAMVVAQTDVEYQRPILFRPEAYDCWSWISHVGRRSMVVESEICDGDVVLSRARVVMVFFDRDTSSPVEPPAELREPLVRALGG
jgi:acyl-CoA thioester hydrolase